MIKDIKTLRQLKKWLESEIESTDNSISDRAYMPYFDPVEKQDYARLCGYNDALRDVMTFVFPYTAKSPLDVIEDVDNAEMLYDFVMARYAQDYRDVSEKESLSIAQFVLEYHADDFLAYYIADRELLL